MSMRQITLPPMIWTFGLNSKLRMIGDKFKTLTITLSILRGFDCRFMEHNLEFILETPFVDVITAM